MKYNTAIYCLRICLQSVRERERALHDGTAASRCHDTVAGPRHKEMRDRTFLEQFVGVYEFMEMQIVVSLKGEHTLSVSFPGQPDYELEPYRGTEFLPRGRSGVSIEFQRDASGVVTGVAATLPNGVFHASKKV